MRFIFAAVFSIAISFNQQIMYKYKECHRICFKLQYFLFLLLCAHLADVSGLVRQLSIAEKYCSCSFGGLHDFYNEIRAMHTRTQKSTNITRMYLCVTVVALSRIFIYMVDIRLYECWKIPFST